MPRIVNDAALDTLFRAARGRRAWLARPVSETLLRAMWELVKLGPTSGAAGPLRLVFVRAEDARARLALAVPQAERTGVMTAPIAAIGACCAEVGSVAAARESALHGAYLILAARALGLYCEPIWQFDEAAVNRMIFPDGRQAAGFLCAMGYGDEAQPSQHPPRPGFDEACAIL